MLSILHLYPEVNCSTAQVKIEAGSKIVTTWTDKEFDCLPIDNPKRRLLNIILNMSSF
jgi:hypothetical protein